MLVSILPLIAAAMVSSHKGGGSEQGSIEQGSVHFRVVGDQSNVPGRYHLSEQSFSYDLISKGDLAATGVEVYHLRFPSPITSPHPENNTVHAEYYRPKGDGRFPGVIVLDITGGNQSLSRSIATHLAQHRIAGLFVQMAYYGPRRPPGSKLRLLSTNIPQTVLAVRQTVLDIRWAAAWLGSRPEIDPERLGILGTSLGSMMAALTAEMEPRLKRVVVLLGGGGLVDVYYDHPYAAPYRKMWEAVGGTKERAVSLLAPVDPLTCAANLKDRRVLIIAGKRDNIIPPRATVALWEASGRQKIVWYDCDHYGAALYFIPALVQVVEHFNAD